MANKLAFALTLALALATRLSLAHAADDSRPMLLAVDGEAQTELPLVSSAMRVVVRGPVAQVQVTQTFSNPSDKPIELVYVFPLHEDGAVGAMTMRIGPRVIRAQIKKRDEARAAYEGAKREGKTAALLEQERPNIFTQSVANVMPGESIDVALTYDVLLDPDGDVYELALPTVVGPRYNPGSPLETITGTGVQPDTDRVPDASRISPEAAPPGLLTGNTVTVDLDVDAGLPIAAIESPTHKIRTKELSRDHFQVGLADGDMVANMDFVLRWRVTVASPTLAALAHKGAGHGHLALVVQPPPVDAGKAPPRELVFVVDTSGSMSGEPLALAKRGMRYALEHLRPEDSFRIMNFSSSVVAFADGRAQPATRDNVRAGLSYVNGVAAGGGTEMMSGIVAALSNPPADGRARFIVFMTDGYIGNEEEIFAAVKKHLDKHTHLFSFGVGSSVNRHLLDGLASSGKGVAQYLLLTEAPEPQIETFYARLDSPLLHDLRVDWGGLDVRDATPGDIADLFAGQPLVVAARYGKGGRGTIKVTGKAAGRTVELAIPVELPARGGDGDVLARLWARHRMAEQLDRLSSGVDHTQRQAIVDDVTGVALEHSLLSPWTAFVAIDEIPRAEGMPTDSVAVPVELPAGVTPQAGNVITGAYSSAIPVGRTFESVLGSAAGSSGDAYGGSFGGATSLESAYYVDGIEQTSVAYGTYVTRRRFVPRLSLSAGLGLGARDGDFASVGLGFERGFGDGEGIDRLMALGLETRFVARGDQSNLFQLMMTLARLAILRRIDLRLGAGGAIDLDGNLGIGWKSELGLLVPFSRKLLPELTLGVSGSTAGENHVGAGLGLGLRW
jgi:Ca-activated chloride channel family protein